MGVHWQLQPISLLFQNQTRVILVKRLASDAPGWLKKEAISRDSNTFLKVSLACPSILPRLSNITPYILPFLLAKYAIVIKFITPRLIILKALYLNFS